jgi:Arm DNA-binding domain
MRLTIKSTNGIELPRGKTDHIEWDDDLPGFGIRLREGGSRGWVFQYALGDKQRRMSLGSAKANGLSLAKAREIASDLHAKVRLGQDPAGQKAESQQRAAETFKAIVDKYLAVREREMRPGAYDQIERHLLKYAKSLHGLQRQISISAPSPPRSTTSATSPATSRATGPDRLCRDSMDGRCSRASSLRTPSPTPANSPNAHASAF